MRRLVCAAKQRDLFVVPEIIYRGIGNPPTQHTCSMLKPYMSNRSECTTGVLIL